MHDVCVQLGSVHVHVCMCGVRTVCTRVQTCMCVPSVCALPGHVQLRALALKCSTQVLAEACHFLSRKLKLK